MKGTAGNPVPAFPAFYARNFSDLVDGTKVVFSLDKIVFMKTSAEPGG